MEANDTALLLRAGSLAAPMDIIEERTIGPSLGADNIKKGFHSTMWGFAAIAVFMILYYQMFGVVSVLALASNLLFLVAMLSLLQATLTLPGIAAIALTLGMAIDANVLINERIREELRAGMPPQAAISEGYERAFGTILDSNITTLIAGLALLIFGSGPDPRLCRGALPGHPDLDLLVGGRLARPGQPDLRPPEEADQGRHRPDLEARQRRHCCGQRQK
jgi:preprotein translocase subunit SecD